MYKNWWNKIGDHLISNHHAYCHPMIRYLEQRLYLLNVSPWFVLTKLLHFQQSKLGRYIASKAFKPFWPTDGLTHFQEVFSNWIFSQSVLFLNRGTFIKIKPISSERGLPHFLYYLVYNLIKPVGIPLIKLSTSTVWYINWLFFLFLP